MKILAVDDDPLSLELLRLAMAEIGEREITLAASAEEARGCVKREPVPYDCFLVDIQMPGIDGIEFCRWLRRLRDYRETPVIMVTAMSARPFLERAFAAGATDYVVKPFDRIELGARLRSAQNFLHAERKAKTSALALDTLRSDLEEAQRFDVDEALCLNDVEGAIDLLALEIHLLRLGRGDLGGVTILSFRIRDFARHHRECAPSELRDMLADVADAILACLLGTECHLAYAGSGVYVAVLRLAGNIDLEDTTVSINQLLADMWLVDGSGNALDLSVVAGRPTPVGMMASGRSAVSALCRVIENARLGVDTIDFVSDTRRGSKAGLLGALFRMN